MLIIEGLAAPFGVVGSPASNPASYGVPGYPDEPVGRVRFVQGCFDHSDFGPAELHIDHYSTSVASVAAGTLEFSHADDGLWLTAVITDPEHIERLLRVPFRGFSVTFVVDDETDDEIQRDGWTDVVNVREVEHVAIAVTRNPCFAITQHRSRWELN